MISECIIWHGAVNKDGYALTSMGSRSDGSRRIVAVHRKVWIEANGPIPNDLEIDHKCNTRNCVNIDHLEPVTHLENMTRSRQRKTVCKNGHPYTEDNIYIWKNKRTCRICRSASAKIMKANAKARSYYG